APSCARQRGHRCTAKRRAAYRSRATWNRRRRVDRARHRCSRSCGASMRDNPIVDAIDALARLTLDQLHTLLASQLRAFPKEYLKGFARRVDAQIALLDSLEALEANRAPRKGHRR